MKDVPCLCDGRSDLHCDAVHCDIAGPGEAGNPNQCRVCWLRLGHPPVGGRLLRSLPCVYLGEVVDQLGCACPAIWIRSCDIHQVCNIGQCKTCPDYEAL